MVKKKKKASQMTGMTSQMSFLLLEDKEDGCAEFHAAE